MAVCECGCGERVSKPGNTWLKGHNGRGKTPSAETRRKIAEAHKGLKMSPGALVRKWRPLLKTDVSKELWEYIDWDSQGPRQFRRQKKWCAYVTCPSCNEGRWIAATEIRRRRSDFIALCSSCFKYVANFQGGPVKVPCAECGQVLIRKRCMLDKWERFYCSKKCMAAHYSENYLGKNSCAWKGGGITVPCSWCGEPTSRKACFSDPSCKTFGKYEHAFCSKECYSAHCSQNRVGENSTNWQGGKSFEPYGPEFNKALKLAIRERDGFICQLCREPENGRIHSCHHIDYDKTNNDPDNLNTLCRSCHTRTGTNRAFWTNLFRARMRLLGGHPRHVGT